METVVHIKTKSRVRITVENSINPSNHWISPKLNFSDIQCMNSQNYQPQKGKNLCFFFKIYFVRLIKMCFVLYGVLIANYICMELYLFWPLFDSLKEAKHFKSKFLCTADVHTMKVVFRLDQLKWNTLYLFTWVSKR